LGDGAFEVMDDEHVVRVLFINAGLVVRVLVPVSGFDEMRIKVPIISLLLLQLRASISLKYLHRHASQPLLAQLPSAAFIS